MRGIREQIPDDVTWGITPTKKEIKNFFKMLENIRPSQYNWSMTPQQEEFFNKVLKNSLKHK